MGFSRILHHTIINPGLTITILKTSWLSTFWPADLHWLISHGGFQRRSITLNRYKRCTHVRLFVLLFLKRRALAFFYRSQYPWLQCQRAIFLEIFIDKCCQNSLVNVVGYCHLDTNLKHWSYRYWLLILVNIVVEPYLITPWSIETLKMIFLTELQKVPPDSLSSFHLVM